MPKPFVSSRRPHSALSVDLNPTFDFRQAKTKTSFRDAVKKSNRGFRRAPVVGALAFGFFVAPCLNDAASTWAQTSLPSATSPLPRPPFDSPLNPETYSVPQGATNVDPWGDAPFSRNPINEQEIEASRFSSGLYGDPAPNNPSPFVAPNRPSHSFAPNDATSQRPIPPFFPASAGDSQPSAARARLEELAWAIGAWELESGGFVFQTKIDWAPGGSYLLCRDFVRPAVAAEAEREAPAATFAALRVVGWNPVAGLYQSTIFCRDGSYGTGLWQREGDAWRVATRILLVDGRAASSVEYFSPRPEGGFAWESTSRTVENTPLPNVGPAQARPIDPKILERLEKSTLSASNADDLPQTEAEFE